MIVLIRIKHRKLFTEDIQFNITISYLNYHFLITLREVKSTNNANSIEFPDSLSSPVPPSLQVGPLDCIQCLHRVYVCKSLLISQH